MALRTHKHRQNVERMAAPVWADPELVFASTVGTVLNRSNLLRWWYSGFAKRRGSDVGASDASPAYTAATLMLNNGVPLEVVSATLGDAGLAITADIYAKVRPELQRTAADGYGQGSRSRSVAPQSPSEPLRAPQSRREPLRGSLCVPRVGLTPEAAENGDANPPRGRQPDGDGERHRLPLPLTA